MKENLNFPIKSNIPYISTKQMIEVDRLMIEEYKINLFQMMENAGRCLAIVGKNLIKNTHEQILVLAGSGGNGGGGLTAARRLYNWGFNVTILLTSDNSKYKDTIGHQLEIVNNIGIEIKNLSDFDYEKKYDIIIDSMIGYSLKGRLKSKIINLITWVNNQKSIRIALDVPTGIDSSTGEVLTKCIKADYTMTLALPKIGFTNSLAKVYIGTLLLADISVPPILYKKAFNIEINNIFGLSDIVIVK